MTNVNYDLRYVAFLDFMGFKNMVNQSTNDADILNTLNKVLDYISYIQHDNYNGTLSMVELGKQVTIFSDSVVISYDTSMPGGGFHILMDLVHICSNLLESGIPVRGGVTVGNLIHTERKCFGPAMIEAYLMESQEAFFPRVIIDPKVIEYDLNNPGPANTVKHEEEYLEQIIQKDVDDKYFLDYLKQWNEFDKPEIYDNYILKTRNFIIDKLHTYKNDIKIYIKYVWLKEYYNNTIKVVYPDYEQLIIP